jgi:hypothetical protein
MGCILSSYFRQNEDDKECLISESNENEDEDEFELKKCQQCDNLMSHDKFIKYYGFCKVCNPQVD